MSLIINHIINNNQNYEKTTIIHCFDFIHTLIYRQDDLLDVLDDETPENKTENIVTATFKGTRILNGHPIENRKNDELEFIISHRFGAIILGFKELFGNIYIFKFSLVMISIYEITTCRESFANCEYLVRFFNFRINKIIEEKVFC